MTYSPASQRINLIARLLSTHCNGALNGATRQETRVVTARLFGMHKLFFSSYPPHQVVGLPSLSPTMETGSIANWNLAEGQSFAAGDIFCSVETDKATVDFEAQDEGVLAKILVPAGSGDVKVGDPVMIIVDDESSVAAFDNYRVEAPTALEYSSPPPPAAAPPPPEPSTPPPTTIVAAPTPSPARPSGGRVVASPLAHMLAKEKGFDISQILGTGPGGRIIAADVKEYVPSAMTALPSAGTAETPAPTQAAMGAPPIPGSGYTDYPLSEEARQVAERLVQSKRNVPHYYLTVDVSCDELLAVRDKLNKSLGKDVKPLGVYELLIKAAAISMKTVPAVNGSWLDSVVRVYDSVDMNVVVGSGDSLFTPIISDCASKGLKNISEDLNNAVSALEPEGEDSPTFLGGVGTFTIMNLGMYGIKSCAPIIREPQSCALAIGSLENRIVPNDDPDSENIYNESVVFTATLSCDHRVVDGAVGAQWLAAFKSHVENPTTLLL